MYLALLITRFKRCASALERRYNEVCSLHHQQGREGDGVGVVPKWSVLPQSSNSDRAQQRELVLFSDRMQAIERILMEPSLKDKTRENLLRMYDDLADRARILEQNNYINKKGVATGSFTAGNSVGGG
ncbi:MAG: hypothetical protein GY820_46625 [Gammaproteobacteria bacterium]|nr:hypothetical protein [Gammaproteobacteria bacterium]